MLKKTLIFSLFASVIFLAPRFSSVSSAIYYNSPVTTFNLSSNNNYCVGQIPVYTIFGGAANANVTWSSTGPSGQTQMTFPLNSSGSFSGNGKAWQASDVGSWTKMATINVTSQNLQFQVTNCGNISANINSQTGNNSGNTYYDPYNNNIFQPLGGTSSTNNSNTSNNSSYMAPGNTYYDPYNNNIFAPLGQSSPASNISNISSNNNNLPGNGNNSYMAPGNTYYNPYGTVPCIDTRC